MEARNQSTECTVTAPVDEQSERAVAAMLRQLGEDQHDEQRRKCNVLLAELAEMRRIAETEPKP